MKGTQSLLSLLVLWGVLALGAGAAARAPNVLSGPDAPPGGEDDPPTFTVVIDAGHGGRDLGTHGDTHAEKDLALEIALALGERLEPEVRVVYTRTEDVFVPLHERAALANATRADLFVSVHCNYLDSRNDWHGSETYVMGLHTAEHNLAVAKRENAVIALEAGTPAGEYGFDPDSPAGHIMLAHHQHASLERSLAAAVALEESLGQRPGRRSRGVKQAGFVVLKETTMPSVLVEVGYLSNDDEEAYLASREGALASADALYAGIARYLREVAGAGGPIPVTASSEVPVERRGGVPTVPEEAPARSGEDRATEAYVQLAASAKTLPAAVTERWAGLGAEVRVLREGGLYKYQLGPFATAEAARAARRRAADDAFVVMYRGGTRVRTPGEW